MSVTTTPEKEENQRPDVSTRALRTREKGREKGGRAGGELSDSERNVIDEAPGRTDKEKSK